MKGPTRGMLALRNCSTSMLAGLRKLSAYCRFAQKRRRIVSLTLMVTLMIAVTSPAPQPHGNYRRESSSIGGGQTQNRWLPKLNLADSFVALAGWMSEKMGRKSRELIASAPPVTTYLNPLPPFLDAPTNLSVIAVSNTPPTAFVSLSWTAPPGSVDHYQVERSQHVNGPFLLLANTGGTTHTDNTVTGGNAYLYRVRAIGSAGTFSTPSNMALGTAFTFEFNQLQGQLIRAQHVYDLRTTINAVRLAANVSAASWALNSLEGVQVQASVVRELREKLGDALSILSISGGPYEDSTLCPDGTPSCTPNTLIKAIHLEQLQTRSTRGSSSSSGPIDSDTSTARLDPLNATGGGGENPLSRNFNWTLPLVNLPGRAGMDLNLSLSYNSLVWTKFGNTMAWDEDEGFPSPGFRLGFPTIQSAYFNLETEKWTHMLIGSDGSRTELRQTSANPNLYESADSSHLLLDTTNLTSPTDPTMLLRTTDGTQLTYRPIGEAFECTEIKDRNGNYITINYNPANYNPSNSISSVKDTLDRTINFNYENGALKSITQAWKNPVNLEPITHTWASFEYLDNLTIQTNFTGASVFGPSNGSTVKVLSRVTLDDNSETLANNSHFDFDYTSWGQVWKIKAYAANNDLLNYRSYNLPLTAAVSQDECPRFTERRDWARYANGDSDASPSVNEEALTKFEVLWNQTWTMPGEPEQSTGTIAEVRSGLLGQGVNGTETANQVTDKIHFVETEGTLGWRRGLPVLVNTYDKDGVLKRQSKMTYEQDESASYPVNPRVRETNIYDPPTTNNPLGNRKRTEITYTQIAGTSSHFPEYIYEYNADASTYLRTTAINYIPDTAAVYSSRRILGLVSEQRLHEGSETGTVKSRVSYEYDSTGSVDGSTVPIKHDGANFGASFVTGRGNLTRINRHSVSGSSVSTEKRKYDRAGSVVSIKDPLDHEVQIAYQDNFSDGVITRDTFAYPKTITDADDFITTLSYNFDFGAVASTQIPKPDLSYYEAGPIRHNQYDSLGRLERVTNSINAAYTRYEYFAANPRVKVFTTIKDGATQQNGLEAETRSFVDGFGRTIGSAIKRESGGFNGQRVEYDVRGRVLKSFNPTQTTAVGEPIGWAPSGDDLVWEYVEQRYDWKGRPTVTFNQDGTTRETVYDGCGCAGGEVVISKDEGNGTQRREQRVYSDGLGRVVKTEIREWEGGQVYSSTANTYNVRDQLKTVTQWAGPENGGGASQVTTMEYDGFGRLETQSTPGQMPIANQSWTSNKTTFHYDIDDRVEYVIDARGVQQNFTYNDRHLVTGYSFVVPAGATGIPTTAPASFTYDAVGNRKKMIDVTGEITYNYNLLSQLASETRVFGSPGQSYTLSYQYNLGGQLKKLTDHTNSAISYQHDTIGQLTAVNGEDNLFANVNQYASNFVYRAWGGIKSASFSNGTSQDTAYNKRMVPTSFQINHLPLWGIPDHHLAWHFTYYNDGRQDTLTNQALEPFDRKFEYDQVGRIKEAYSGFEARGEQQVGQFPNSPFRQSFQYNAFNDRTQKSGRFWRTPQIGNTPCIPRQANDGCDSEGNMTNNNQNIHRYDAAGRQVKFEDWRDSVGGTPTHPEVHPIVEITQTYDADGRPTSRGETRWREDEVSGPLSDGSGTTYLYSTVLGAKVAELGGMNGPLTSYVYANGMRIAKQERDWADNEKVTWVHNNPGSNSWVETDENKVARQEEMDPDGADVGTEDPWANLIEEPTYQSLKDNEPLYIEGGDPFDYSGGCTSFGMPISCADAAGSVQRGLGTINQIGVNPNPRGPQDGKSAFVDLINLTPYYRGDTKIHYPSERRLVGLPYVTPQGISSTKKSVKHSKEDIKKAISDCIEELWNEDGKLNIRLDNFEATTSNKWGKASLTIARGLDNVQSATIHNSIEFSGEELGVISTLSNDETYYIGYKLLGYALPAGTHKISANGATRYFTPYVNYTASDRGSLNSHLSTLQAAIGGFMSTQIHELGNSIEFITGKKVGKPSNGLDPDGGFQLQGCVGIKLTGVFP